MKREGGWTLVELMGSLALIGAASFVAAALVQHARRTSDLGAAYALDVTETRRALDAVESDLRAARDVRTSKNRLVVTTDVGDVTWTLDRSSLRRAGTTMARNVAAFDARREGGDVAVSIQLGRRSPEATRSARVETLVHPRALAESVR